MIKKFALTALACCIFTPAITADESRREIPLEASTLSGACINGDIIKLHDTLPVQNDSENIVIESENALNLFFQEDVFARKSGQKADELIQIKQAAKDYTPQPDKDASSGKYIDYCSSALYQFGVNTPGKYHVWARHWVPVVANWNYSIALDGTKESISLADKIPAAGKWLWVKCFDIDLAKGSHSLRISDLLNGKRLDAIVLTLDEKWEPDKEKLVPTPLKTIEDGTVYFKPVMPVGFLKWEKLVFSQLKPGNYLFSVSTDGGKTWFPLTSPDLSTLGSNAVSPLEIKLEMKRENGIAPELSSVKASYLFDSDSFITLEDDFIQLLFARDSGCISGILNRKTGKAYQSAGIKTNMFDILLKKPGNKERIWLSHPQAALVKASLVDKNKVLIEWAFKEYSITVRFDISLAGKGEVKWAVTVINDNRDFDVLEIEAPKLTELRISEKASDDMLVWPFSAGEFVYFPASLGEHSIAYPDHAGLPFVDLYNSEEGLYFGCHDPFLTATHFIRRANMAQNALELSVNRIHRISPGTSRTYHFAMAVHDGDWHKGALVYRSYFYSQYPVNSYKPWLRSCDAWLVGNESGHAGLTKKSKDYSVIEGDFKRAAFLSLPYIQAWGSTFNGACPTFYLPRKDKGGAEMFVGMIDKWRKAGGEIGYYFHGNAVTPYYLLTDKYFGVDWSEYPEKLRPPTWDWYIKNREYTSENSAVDKEKLLKATAELNAMHKKNLDFKHGNQEESITGYMPMSWRSDAFPDYLKKWIGIYIKEYHCCTAYLDTFSFRNERADFNPYLGLHGEGDKPMFKMEFLKSMLTEMRKTEPGFCALTEGIADVFGTYIYFLLSGFARDPNIFRYTIPDQIIFQGNCNGLWTKPLSRKSLTQSFMLGNRFDYSCMFPHSYHLLRLRQRVSPFLNFAIFNDNVGIKVTDPSVTVYSHIALPGTEKFIENYGSRAVTFTIDNPLLATADVSYELPDGFKPVKAYICSIYEDPVELKFSIDGGKLKFNVPEKETSCAVFVQSLNDPHRWTAVQTQTDINNVKVDIFNYNDTDETFTVSAKTSSGETLCTYENVIVPGGSLKTINISNSLKNSDFKIVKLKVSTASFEREYIISIGNSGQTVPKPEKYAAPPKKTPEKQSAVSGSWTPVFSMDFEGDEFANDAAAKGKGCFKLIGNGGMKLHKFPLKLEKNCKYRVQLFHKKDFDVSQAGYDNNVSIANYTPENKLELYAQLGLSSPRDNKWHNLAGTFSTSENLNNCGLYVYNKNSNGTVCIDEVKIEKYTP